MSLIYELKTIIEYGLYGLVLGLLVNRLGKRLYDRLGVQDLNMEIFGQMFLCGLVLAVLKVYAPNTILSTVQEEIPGIMFIAFFFGVQYLSFNSIQQIYGIIPLSDGKIRNTPQPRGSPIGPTLT